jgi:hypothetical protein
MCVFGNLLEDSTTLTMDHTRMFQPILFVILSHLFLLGLFGNSKVNLSHLYFWTRIFSTRKTKMCDDETMYALMKDMPDFDCMPIPQSWFKKFGIPPRNPVPVREFIHSNYAVVMAQKPKDLPPLYIDEPQQDGKLATFVPAEEVKVEVISRPFVMPENGRFPDVLPSLREMPVEDGQTDESHHCKSIEEKQD